MTAENEANGASAVSTATAAFSRNLSKHDNGTRARARIRQIAGARRKAGASPAATFATQSRAPVVNSLRLLRDPDRDRGALVVLIKRFGK